MINLLTPKAFIPSGLVLILHLVHAWLSHRHNKNNANEKPSVNKGATNKKAHHGNPINSRRTVILLKVGTAIFDYTGVIIALLSLSRWGGGDTLDPLWWACNFGLIPLYSTLRDELMIKVLGKWISPLKAAAGTNMADVMCAIKIDIFVSAVIYTLVALDIARFPKITGIGDWIHIWAEFIAITFIKDVTSMHFLHDWMHKGYAYQAFHKRHHMNARSNTKSFHAWQFDCLDVAIENSFGPIILSMVYKMLGVSSEGQSLLGLPPIHLGAFVLSIIADTNLHSANPYTVYFYNPILDHFMNANICHQLHHSINAGYLTTIPFHHLIEGKQKDMQKYNMYCKTNFPC